MDINKEEHFKLYILSEHRFTFESELNKRGISFYSDAEEQVFSSHSIRYYLKTSDREQINQIIVNNKIDSGLESGGLNRFDFGPKPFKILIGVAIVIILIFSILASLVSCSNKPDINPKELSRELDSIMVVDQKYRAEMQVVGQEHGWDSPEMDELWSKQNQIDESNLERIVEIIEMVGGYPGKSLVGNKSSKVTFFVLQHAPDSIQQQYFDLIMEAADNYELDKRLAAMYRDRYLMHRGEPQVFGTQVRSVYEIDTLTGERVKVTTVWPIADTTNIDSVRMWNGLGPLEDYLNSFGISRWE